MQIITDIGEMQRRCFEARAEGKTIAFVPTMGFLHDGHLSLMHEGRQRGDILVLSIFVNPAQFGPNEDLDKYPRDFKRDEEMARMAGVDWIYCPTPEVMYPPGYATYVDVQGVLTDVLEGASRPGHFRGVATVVTKLFNIVQPSLALFGQKDFQQLAVIRRMTTDLNLPVDILGMPIVRETDGLAMSSRNVYLSAAEREQALALNEVIRSSAALAKQGERNAATILAKARQRLAKEPDLVIDYAKICHAQTLAEISTLDHESVMLLAVRVGKTRLIDNGYLLS